MERMTPKMPTVRMSQSIFANSRDTKSPTPKNNNFSTSREAKSFCLPTAHGYAFWLLMAILIFPGRGMAQSPEDFVAISRKELDKITTCYEEDFKSIAQIPGNRNPKIYVSHYDVDGDGKAELLITIGHSTFCGTGGCSVDIFERTPSGWRLIDLGFPSLHRVPQKTGSSTNGMPDYVFDDNLWKFDGKRYQWRRKVHKGEFGLENYGKLLPQLR